MDPELRRPAAPRRAGRDAPTDDLTGAMLDALERGRGYLVLRREPRLSIDDCLARFVGLASSLGDNVSRDAAGNSVPYAVIESAADPSFAGVYVGDAFSRNSIPLHSDASGEGERRVDVLGMFCVRRAAAGGETVLCDPLPVIARLSERERALLRQPWPRRHPFAAAGPRAWVAKPILGDGAGEAPFSYGYQRLRLGLETLDEPSRSERRALLDELNALLEAAAEELLLADGDAIFVDNRRILHGRRGFVDSSDAKRRMLRVWIRRRRSAADS